MRNVIFLISVLFLFSGCAPKGEWEPDYTGGNMQYDQFRGSSSSIANQVQFEAFKKCIDTLKFSTYAGKTVDIEVNAGNSQIAMQINTLLNIIFIKNGTVVAEKVYVGNEKAKPDEYDYMLKINAVCGGYHFYPGIIFHKYQTTARIVMLETESGDEKISRHFDSGYKDASVFKPVFTQEFRTSVYIIFFLLVALILLRFGLLNWIRKEDKK